MGLMEKYFELKGSPKQIDISSAMAIDGMTGRIFIEAHSLGDVKKAVEGFFAITKPYIKLVGY